MKNPSSGLVLSYREAVAAGTIESRVRPLVDALNHLCVVQTVASCEGHFARRGMLARRWECVSRPYVSFVADGQFSKALALWLGLGRGPMAELHHVWWLTGNYRLPEAAVIQWCLEPNDVRLSPGSYHQARVECSPDLLALDLATLAIAASAITAAVANSFVASRQDG